MPRACQFQVTRPRDLENPHLGFAAFTYAERAIWMSRQRECQLRVSVTSRVVW